MMHAERWLGVAGGLLGAFLLAASGAAAQPASGSAAASANRCDLLPLGATTGKDFVGLMASRFKGIQVDPEGEVNQCFPKSRNFAVFGAPVCYLDGAIPVNGVVATAPLPDAPVEHYYFAMRGQPADLRNIQAYFTKRFPSATAEFLNTVRHQAFHGPVFAWKDGAKFIVVYQQEPGHQPEELSLILHYGDKQAMEKQAVNLNTCK